MVVTTSGDGRWSAFPNRWFRWRWLWQKAVVACLSLCPPPKLLIYVCSCRALLPTNIDDISGGCRLFWRVGAHWWAARNWLLIQRLLMASRYLLFLKGGSNHWVVGRWWPLGRWPQGGIYAIPKMPPAERHFRRVLHPPYAFLLSGFTKWNCQVICQTLVRDLNRLEPSPSAFKKY